MLYWSVQAASVLGRLTFIIFPNALLDACLLQHFIVCLYFVTLHSLKIAATNWFNNRYSLYHRHRRPNLPTLTDLQQLCSFCDFIEWNAHTHKYAYTWGASSTPYVMKSSPLSDWLYWILKLLTQLSSSPVDSRNSTTIRSVNVSST